MTIDLLDAGFARLPALLTAAECAELRDMYDDDRRFRSRVDMARYRFGEGEYRYFDRPLPDAASASAPGVRSRPAPPGCGDRGPRG